MKKYVRKYYGTLSITTILTTFFIAKDKGILSEEIINDLSWYITGNNEITNIIGSIFIHLTETHLIINLAIIITGGIIIESKINGIKYMTLFFLIGTLTITISNTMFHYNLIHTDLEVTLLGASAATWGLGAITLITLAESIRNKIETKNNKILNEKIITTTALLPILVVFYYEYTRFLTRSQADLPGVVHATSIIVGLTIWAIIKTPQTIPKTKNLSIKIKQTIKNTKI